MPYARLIFPSFGVKLYDEGGGSLRLYFIVFIEIIEIVGD